jgi:hypothetical protein
VINPGLGGSVINLLRVVGTVASVRAVFVRPGVSVFVVVGFP